MTQSEIELIDGEYGVVRKDRISSNQIKTRPSSFNAISKVWKDFRLKFYTDRLNAEKESALTQKFDVDDENKLTSNAVEQINNKSLVIARLEEKIKILSKESVPSNYVDNRAIKLRSKMMNNLVNNSGSAYSIGVDKMEEVFGAEVNENITPVVDNAVNDDSSNIDIDVSAADAKVDADESTMIESFPAFEEQQPIDIDVIPVVPVESETNVETVNNFEPEQEVNDNELTKVNDEVSVPLEVSSPEDSDISISRVDIKDAVDSAFNSETAEDTSIDMVDDNNVIVEPVSSDDGQFDESSIDSYEAGDDVLVFDNDEPALFELINPAENEDEVIVSDVKTDYSSNLNDTPVISDSYEDISVSKNGSAKAKIDKYKSDGQMNTSLKPFKIITFKDIFRPADMSLDEFNLMPTTGTIEKNVNDDRYVPLIVPERSVSQEKINVISETNDFELNVSNVEEMKNKYLQLQKLLRSKTARLNSVRAEREAIRSEVENSSKDKDAVTANLNEKYQLMAKYIGDLQKQCAMIDDETASNENDITNSRQIIEDNRQVVSSTQRTIEELDDILRDGDLNIDDDNEYHQIRRVA